MSLHVGINDPATEKLFRNHTIPTLKHNNKLRRHLADNIQEVIVKTPSGIIAGRAKTVEWDNEAHGRIIERTVRGLYYHHFGVILGDKAAVDVQWFDVDSPQVAKWTNTKLISKNTVGEGHVAYYYVGEPEVAPYRSAWIFQFYGRHWAGGVTRPVDDKDLEFKASFLKRIRI